MVHLFINRSHMDLWSSLDFITPSYCWTSGYVFDYNPVMKFAKRFLQKNPSAYIPEDKEQQNFNQLIAITLLALGFVGYTLNWNALALTATIMVATASFVAILGFCVGCFIRFRWQQYRYHKAHNQN